MKIVLAGSPEITIPAFEEVVKNFEVVSIITQPDRPQGRGMVMQETHVASFGKRHNIKVFKPEKIKDIYEELKALDYDLLLTFAFGQFIPTSILQLGKYKPLNIHGSLLPKYRGASPIHQAILNGDQEIGITLMEMIKEMDAGDIYFQAKVRINENTTTGEGFEIVAKLAKDNIVSWLKLIETNDYKTIPQGNDFSTCSKIDKNFGLLSSDLSILEATRKIRGLNPFPCSFIFIENKRLKVFNVSNNQVNNSIELAFNDGTLYAIDYQWEGKKRIIL